MPGTGVRQVGDDPDAGEGPEHVRRGGHHLRSMGSGFGVWGALALSHTGCPSDFTPKVVFASNPTGIDLRVPTTGVRQVGDDPDAGEGPEHVRREGHHQLPQPQVGHAQRALRVPVLLHFFITFGPHKTSKTFFFITLQPRVERYTSL